MLATVSRWPTGAVAHLSSNANDNTMLMLAELANTLSVFSDAARQHMMTVSLYITISRQDTAGKKAAAQNKNYRTTSP